MLSSFTCPNCNAPLQYKPSDLVLTCEYCKSTIILPSPPNMGPPQADPLIPDPSLSEVATLFRAGKRVQATILYREITGASLQEARIAIDRFAAGEPLRRPNRMGF